MSKEKLDDLDRRQSAMLARAARAYAEMETLERDIKAVESRLKDLGISSIEEAKERIAEATNRAEIAMNKASELLDKAEGLVED